MSIFDSLLSTFAAHECLGCGAESRLLCSYCVKSLQPAGPRCYRCQQRSAGGYTCERCLGVSPLSRVQAVYAYDGYAKDLLWKLKSNGAQAAAREAAQLCLVSLDVIPSTSRCYLVPVPTASSRARVRGYDQAVLLARNLSRQLHLPFKNYLIRRGQAHQVGASRQQRLKQIAGAFRVKNATRLQGAHIILVDDVLTTGASLETAAKVLHQAGASHIEAVVFAQA